MPADHSAKRPHLLVLLFLIAMLLGTSLIFWILVRQQEESRKLTLSAERPVWKASIDGVDGDLAEIWIWTSSATLRTNLPVPVSLKLDRKSLLLAVRSRGNRDLTLHMNSGTPTGGSAHVPLKAGQTNVAVFVSRSRIPGMPVDFFMATTFAPGMPMEVMPVFGPFWGSGAVGFAEVKGARDTNAVQQVP